MPDLGPARDVIGQGVDVEEALRRAVAAARCEYVRAGLSMPVWRLGRLMWIEPTELMQYEADGDAPPDGHKGARDKDAV
jgi:hypothetical protein